MKQLELFPIYDTKYKTVWINNLMDIGWEMEEKGDIV